MISTDPLHRLAFTLISKSKRRRKSTHPFSHFMAHRQFTLWHSSARRCTLASRGVAKSLTLLAVLAGCDQLPTDSVRVVEAPPTEFDVEFFPGVQTQPHCILVAVIESGERAWFCKLAGSCSDVNAVREEFAAVMQSTTFDDRGIPQWKLPDGWAEQPGDGRMRFTNIRIDSTDPPQQIAVSLMPLQEDRLHFQLHNVNRWRRQLQLPPIGPAELEPVVEGETAGGNPLAIFRLAGRLVNLPDPPQRPSVSPANDRPLQPAAGAPDEAAGAGFTFELPPGWRSEGKRPMRKATFVVEGDAGTAEVVVSAWPATAGSQMADPLANVNRWRGQVGLPPIDAAELLKTLEPLRVSDLAGAYVSLDPPPDSGTPAGLAMRAVLVKRENDVWFFKLSGVPAVVDEETVRFKEFIESVRFVSP